MSEYKMNQYELQSYFKSLCNSFYIAYEQVTRLEKEENDLANGYNEENLETVKDLLAITENLTAPSNYFTLKFSQEELEKEKERLEAQKQEYDRKLEELEKIRSYWANHMWQDSEAIKSVLYTIKDNHFSIIVTTKAEIYALMRFYYGHKVEDYPVVNMEKEYRETFPTGEDLYDDFLKAYEFDFLTDAKGVEDRAMQELYEKYF